MWGQKNDSTFFLNERIYICKAEFFNLSFKIVSNKTADHFDFNFNFLTNVQTLS
jgi:hypothetical protein